MDDCEITQIYEAVSVFMEHHALAVLDAFRRNAAASNCIILQNESSHFDRLNKLQISLLTPFSKGVTMSKQQIKM